MSGAVERLVDGRLKAPPAEEFLACDTCSGGAFHALQQAGLAACSVAAITRLRCCRCGREVVRQQGSPR